MPRTKRLVGGLMVASVAVAMLAAATFPREKPECEVAQEWVAANIDRLPTTLDSLAMYSVTYRRAIYSALPTATRSALWRQHFMTFLGPASTLNEDQRTIVRDALENIDAYLADRTKTDALRARVLASFSGQEGRRIFAMLGPETPLGAASARSNLVTCECAVGDNWCSFEHCWASETCTRVEGCGTIWLETCDGMCGPG